MQVPEAGTIRQEMEMSKYILIQMSSESLDPTPQCPRSAPGKPQWHHPVQGEIRFNNYTKLCFHLLHLQGLGGLIIVDPAAVEQETKAGNGDAYLRKDYMIIRKVTQDWPTLSL